MKTDSSIKILLFLILAVLIYIGYQSTMIAKSVSNINNTMDSTTTDGSGGGTKQPKKAFFVQPTSGTGTDTTGSGSGGGPKKLSADSSTDTSGGKGKDPKLLRKVRQ